MDRTIIYRLCNGAVINRENFDVVYYILSNRNLFTIHDDKNPFYMNTREMLVKSILSYCMERNKNFSTSEISDLIREIDKLDTEEKKKCPKTMMYYDTFCTAPKETQFKVTGLFCNEAALFGKTDSVNIFSRISEIEFNLISKTYMSTGLFMKSDSPENRHCFDKIKYCYTAETFRDMVKTANDISDIAQAFEKTSGITIINPVVKVNNSRYACLSFEFETFSNDSLDEKIRINLI